MNHAKRLFFLLTVMAVLFSNIAAAQEGRDTVLTFYFNTNAHTINEKQQKALDTFLQKVQRIKWIKGFADSTGTHAHNEVLSLWRALEIYNRLPKNYQQGVPVIAEGETNELELLWQNRRAEVVAVLIENTSVATGPGIAPANDSSRITELTIEQLLFIPDQPELTEASLKYIPLLAQQLLQYEGAHFQIIGHVNYQSKLPPERLTDLYELSENRAKAVYELLVQNGIEAHRMSYKGVGNSQPIIANPANDDEKRKNMRVQVLVIRQ
ncbi:MAG: OmpA family protein [Chitinophagaceae bacterium]